MSKGQFDLILGILKEHRKENISHKEKEEIDKLLWILTSISEKVEKDGQYFFSMELYARSLNELVKHILLSLERTIEENKELRMKVRDLESKLKRSGD